MRRIDTFCQGNRQVGRRFRYTDGQRILEILREAHCPIEPGEELPGRALPRP